MSRIGRLTVWLCVIAAMAITALMTHNTRWRLDTNLLDLLPKNQIDPGFSEATKRFTQQRSQQLIFLVGAKRQAQAIAAADLFAAKLKRTGAFNHINAAMSEKTQQAWGKFYFTHRAGLVSESDRILLQKGERAQLVRQALFALYGPMSVVSGKMLAHDPFFLFQRYMMSLHKPSAKVQLRQQHLMVQSKGQWYVLVTAATRDGAFSLSAQNLLVHEISQSISAVKLHWPAIRVLRTGVLFYAADGAHSARADITLISLGSIIGIILLMVWIFKGVGPLLLTLFSGGVGFVVAFVVTSAIFGKLFLLTLVFGASLIGIAVDYAFFYLSERHYGGVAWCAEQGLAMIFSGVTLGLLNILIAYAILLLTPFPALKQLACFSLVGLTMAYLTVVCVFPIVLKAYPLMPATVLERAFWRVAVFWRNARGRTVFFIVLVLASFNLVGIAQLKVNDSIKALQPMNPKLRVEQREIQKLTGNVFGLNALLVRAQSPTQVLARLHTLKEKLSQRFSSVPQPTMSVADYVPTLKSQQHAFEHINQLLYQKGLPAYLKKLGFDKTRQQVIATQLRDAKRPLLTLSSWLHAPVSTQLRFLWLGKIGKQYYTAMLLNQMLPLSQLREMINPIPYSYLMSQAATLSQLFGECRVNCLRLLGFVVMILCIAFCIRYGFAKAGLVLLPPLFGVGTSLGMLGYLGLPLTLFNTLALFIVLGIGCDYVLFFAETTGKPEATTLAVALSVLTTLLSFGLLVVSRTPVVALFGLTVAVGILTAALLAPLANRPHRRQGE